MKLVRHNLNLMMQSTASRKRDRNGFVYQSALQAKKTLRSCGGTPISEMIDTLVGDVLFSCIF